MSEKDVSLKIRDIRQVDSYTFVIEWSDEVLNFYRLSDLQRNCPCAGCHAENSEFAYGDEDVKAISITNVGSYAIRITFASGCSRGIYDFQMLRQLGRK
jgi:DUF971 family protein